jgi:hypothetical protein
MSKCPDCGGVAGKAHVCRAALKKARTAPAPKEEPTKWSWQKPPAAVRAPRVPTKKEKVAELRETAERLTSHPDCPVCKRRRERQAELMRRRREKKA